MESLFQHFKGVIYMTIATYQKKVFQVSGTKKYTFDGLSLSGSLDTEAQDKLNHKPSTYIKGEFLDSLQIDIPLRADFGMNVRNEIEEWKRIKSNKKPDFFILGNKPLGKNKWLLKSVDVSDVEIDNNGFMLKAKISLKIEEYVRTGTASASKSNQTAVSFDLETLASNQQPNMDIYSPYDKEEDRRDNLNKMIAMKKGLKGWA